MARDESSRARARAGSIEVPEDRAAAEWGKRRDGILYAPRVLFESSQLTLEEIHEDWKGSDCNDCDGTGEREWCSDESPFDGSWDSGTMLCDGCGGSGGQGLWVPRKCRLCDGRGDFPLPGEEARVSCAHCLATGFAWSRDHAELVRYTGWIRGPGRGGSCRDHNEPDCACNWWPGDSDELDTDSHVCLDLDLEAWMDGVARFSESAYIAGVWGILDEWVKQNRSWDTVSKDMSARFRRCISHPSKGSLEALWSCITLFGHASTNPFRDAVDWAGQSLGELNYRDQNPRLRLRNSLRWSTGLEETVKRSAAEHGVRCFALQELH